jgi:hypothetical protein
VSADDDAIEQQIITDDEVVLLDIVRKPGLASAAKVRALHSCAAAMSQ